jgi:lysyl-tRNA synthetase class 2
MGRQEEIVAERLKKLALLKKQNLNPYLSNYETTHITSELQHEYAKLDKGEVTKKVVRIAGRLKTFRDFGKIAFGVLDDGHATLQVTLQKPATPQKIFDFVKELVDIGDFIGVEGNIARSERGELSVIAKEITMLTKSVLPLPDKWHGITDDEERLRKRYLDVLMNKEIKEMFIRKSTFWNTIRTFLLERGFLEVETPVLENAAGGASATPFKTHHNALDLDVYLRISMGELWQKKLMVAGFPKTFEIGRQFRNEGMDAEHLQDYTQMEFYWGYANYKDGMKLVEEMYKQVAKKVYGKTKFKIGDFDVDLGKKWEIVDYAETIKQELGVDVFKVTKQDMEKKLKNLKQDFQPGLERGRLMDLLWKVCRRKIAGPAFLTGQPVEVSPLAKRDSKDPRKVEQFQVIIAGSEMGNGYSELNDPIDQQDRFEEQRRLKEAGDAEAQDHDESFVEALKYGMPPTCGFGVSERLFSIFEGKPIRETVLFPLMRPEIEDTHD